MSTTKETVPAMMEPGENTFAPKPKVTPSPKVQLNKKVFTIKDDDGKDVVLAVVRPKPKQLEDANLRKCKAFCDAVKAGGMLTAALDSYLADQKIWGAEKQLEFDKLQKNLLENEKKVKGKAGRIKESECKKLAVQMIKDRNSLLDLVSVKNSITANTVEAQAENYWFNYLVSVCTVYNESGKLYFKDYDDYLEQSTKEVSELAASNLMPLVYGVDLDYKSKQPEYQFLKAYGYVDDKFRLINKDGHLVDEDGKLINDLGQYVDEHDNPIDRDGNARDADGNMVGEAFENFIDKD